MLVLSYLLVGILGMVAAAGGWLLSRQRKEDAEAVLGRGSAGGAGRGASAGTSASAPGQHRVWRVAPAPHDFFEAPRALAVNGREFAAGCGMPGFRVHEQQLASELPALLTGTVAATFLSLPIAADARGAAAATGAGVMAWPVDPESVPAALAAGFEQGGRLSDPAEARPSRFTAHPEPGWLLGLNAAGHPVVVQLVPGSTILVHGGGRAEQLCERLPTGAAWVRLLRAEGNTQLGKQWRDAWSPSTCRVVLASSISDATAHAIIPDLIIDAKGEVEHRGKVVRFEPLERIGVPTAARWL